MNNAFRGIFMGMALMMGTVIACAQSDTVSLRKNQVLLISDSLFIPERDTLLLIPSGTDYQVLDNKYVLTEEFYDSAYSIAQRSKVTKELYNLLITNRPPQDPFSNKEPVRSEAFFEVFQGKTIVSIDYVPVDLFGGSVTDTTLKAQSSLGKITNDLHQNTINEVIQRYLLFAVGDKINAYEMADTERIIRSLSYIEDVRILIRLDPKNLQNAHVTIVTKDRFPWSINISIDDNDAYRVGFTNQNILGTGNEFGVGYLHHPAEAPAHGYDAHYTIRNIENSFIDGTVFFSNNYLGKSKGITFKRDFLSPNIKYYGEATFEHVQPISDLIFADSLFEKDFNIDRKSYDLWGARSFLIDDRKTLNAALRLQHDNFDERPLIRPDSNVTYHNHHFLIGGLSYSKINFLKTKNILSFNITEDVPVGFIYSILVGKDFTEFGEREYRGVQMSYSTYKKQFGYIFMNVESGYFSMENRRTNQVLQIDGRHFTPLLDLGGAYSRVFTRFHYFDGDRLSIPLSQSLADQNRIRNIEGMQIQGNRLMTLTSEYVVFQPWYFYGFRFATYGHLGVGNVSESRIQDPFTKTYWTMGGGVRIRNESLVFNTFEFRVSLFPNAPTEGQPFYFKISLSAPQFFQNPNARKPRIVGLD